MTANWYRNERGAAVGPFTLEELGFLASRSKLSADDLLRQGKSGPWIRAAEVPGLMLGLTGDRPSADGLPAPSPPPGASPPPRRPPPLQPTRNDANLQVALGAAVGVGLLLVMVLLVALFMRQSPQEVAEGGRRQRPTPAPSESQPSKSEAESEPVEPSAKPTEKETSPAAIAASPSEKPKSESQVPAAPVDKPTSEPPAAPAQPKPAPPAPMPAEKGGAKEGDLATIVRQPTAEEDDIKPGGPPAALPEAMRDQFAGRAPEKRERLAVADGGSAETEAAVERGLEWLAAHQHEDGHWSLDHFHDAKQCAGKCATPGALSDSVVGTALALLPFLGAGYTHQKGKYQETVGRGVAWLVNDQIGSGTFHSKESGRMYSHGMATIALCELVAMTGDRAIKPDAQRATSYLVEAQDPGGGGWRYTPHEPGDLSVTGWQMMALRSAQIGELHVPQLTIDRATKFLDAVQSDTQGSKYGYTDGDFPTPTRTAVGLLCRLYTGWGRKEPGLEKGVSYLLEHLPNDPTGDMYYWYNATQVLHHVGGKPWQQWNDVMREILIRTQLRDGHLAGSWSPKRGHDFVGGRVYMTALAVCTLEVYYRHLPLLRAQAVK